MPEAFDPYHTWLGIPPHEQPPHHYRLLAIQPFEANPRVIEHAADRQMAHLRTLQTGQHAKLSQKLLNEVAAARICLLNAEKKAAYDQRLRRELGTKQAARKSPVAARAPGEGPVDRASGDPHALGHLGEYRLLEKLGAGGMGEVYKAVHTEMDRVVAVKVLPPGHLHDERAVARFKREIKAVASLSHPNIVQAFDAREIEGTRFLVMEYVEGMDLRDVAKRLGPLPIPDACELIRQAALGLQCAHEHGLVHRDIKPGNLMLTAQGQLKVLDLGLARPQAEGDDDVTGTGEAMGTADYMAPEQAADSRSVDIRADIYSLGCTLYRLIAGRPPFSGPKYSSAVKKLMGHIQDPVPQITRLRGDVPKRLEIVLGRLLAKDPAKRLSTPAELADALVPLSVGADLPGLYARATGAPATDSPSAREQATMGVQESQSTGLTHFLQKLKGGGPVPAEAPAASPSARKRLPPYLAYAAVAAVVLLLAIALGVALTTRSSDKEPVAGGPSEEDRAAKPNKRPPAPRKTQHLLLQWPRNEREDAKLEIDRGERKIADLVDSKNPDQLKMEVTPGVHKVWIARRGFEPFEQTLKVDTGQAVTVVPEWKKVPEVAVAPPPKPEEKPEPPKPKPKPPKPKETTPGPKPPEIDPALKRQQELDAKYAQALEPIEAMVCAWDFSGAVAALAKVEFDDPALMSRRNARGRELQRMAGLKDRLIAKINTADPPLKKSDLMLRGINGDVAKADQESVTAKLASGKTESHVWSELSEQTRSRLAQLVVDPASADDWLSAGLLAFASGDVALAEKLLAQAQSRGAEIGPYLASLAERALADANGLLEKKEFSKAAAALANIEKKYTKTPWFASRRKPFDAARAAAKTGAYEAEAEKLYAQAAKLFKEDAPFDLKPLVEKLKTNYADSQAVTDADRKPPFAEMEKAVADLGSIITVRQGGHGGFRSIQAAINKAPPNSLIEIQDAGPYNEEVKIPREKQGLTIRGKKGCWPIITAGGDRIAILAEAAELTLERLVITGPLHANWGPVHVRSSILSKSQFNAGPSVDLDTCVSVGDTSSKIPITVSNSVRLTANEASPQTDEL